MSAEPYADAASHLRDELRRAWLRVEYQIRIGWSREQPSLATDTVGPADIGKLFATARGEQTVTDTGANAVLEQWLAAHRAVASVIAGATRPEQVRANVAAASWTLSPAELAEVDRLATRA